jgi:hypothetical protein
MRVCKKWTKILKGSLNTHTYKEVNVSETLEELKQRTIDKRLARQKMKQQTTKPRRPWYTFLPKDEKRVVDFMDVKLIEGAMEGGQHELILEVLGSIANLKRITGQISQDQQNALDCVNDWYKKSKVYDEAAK